MTPFIPPSRVRPCDRMLARAAFLILLSLFTATFTGTPENPDAEVEYQTTSSIARRGSLDVGGTPEAEAILAAPARGREGTGFNVAEGGPLRQGRYYSWFGVGQAYTGVPLWWLGHGISKLAPSFEERHRQTTHFRAGRSEYFEHLACGWRNSLLTALTAWLIVLAARRIGASGRASFLAGLTYGIATYAWPQARSTLSDVQATFLLFLAFHLILLVREDYIRGRLPSSLNAALIGFALGGAFLTRVAVAIAVAGLGLLAVSVIVKRHRKHASGSPFGRLFWLAAPFLTCVFVFLGTNDLRFGDVLESGYGDVLGDFFSGVPHEALAGVLFSPGKGLLWMAPGILLLPFGILHARRRSEKLWPWALAAVSLGVLAPVAFMQGWHGAWTYGPRYVLPLLPFAWLGVALALDLAGERPVRRFLAYALVFSGLAVSLPAVFVDYTTNHDLSWKAAKLEWPDGGGESEFERDDARYLRVQWDFRFAAPWAHWRILRHRLAGLGEEFPVRSIYFVDDDAVLTPTFERFRGLRHLAWVDFQERLGGPIWPAVLVCLGLFVAGLACLGRGLDDPAL